MKTVIFKGGLGNQLFQLCKYFELKNSFKNEKIKVDTFSAFLLDFKYNRKSELSDLIHKNYRVNFIFICINISLILLNKKIPILRKFLKNIVIYDKSHFKNNKIKKINLFNYEIVNGYFQNFELVKNYRKEIIYLSKQKFNSKANDKFEELYIKIKSNKNSIAICYRSYEESKDPLEHSFNRRLIKVNDYNAVIKKLENELNNPHFFVFSQNNNNFIKNLKFNSKKTYVLAQNGFGASWSTLKAQFLCEHQVLNNSTFYYWGLIFSEDFHKEKRKKKIVYVTNNFINQSVYDPSWRKF